MKQSFEEYCNKLIADSNKNFGPEEFNQGNG